MPGVIKVPVACPLPSAFMGILCLGIPEFHIGPVLGKRQVLAFVFSLSAMCGEYTIFSCLIKLP